MKKRIVEYVSRMKDGGAETIVRDYAILLDKNLFDVTVVCEDYKKNSANYRMLQEHNIKCIFTYGKFDYLCRLLARIFGAKFKSFLLKKTLNKIKPDVIHIHLESLEVIKCLSEELKNIKLVFTCQNTPKVCIGSDRPRENEACKYLLEHNNLQILALHKDMANEINKMFNIDNVLVFRSGTDFNRFLNIKQSREEIRKSLGLPEDCYLIGHIGRFMYQKNHEFLIRVFSEVVKRKNNAYLLLIGSGKLKYEIYKQISELGLNDRVVNIYDRTDTPVLFKAMDVFLFPSRFEGLSVSMLEAQVSNIPCVVSNRINNETYCSKNIVELSLDDDIEKWAEECINPIANIDKWNEINEYDINKIILGLQELYLN